jgi:hypothetical protein
MDISCLEETLVLLLGANCVPTISEPQYVVWDFDGKMGHKNIYLEII